MSMTSASTLFKIAIWFTKKPNRLVYGELLMLICC